MRTRLVITLSSMIRVCLGKCTGTHEIFCRLPCVIFIRVTFPSNEILNAFLAIFAWAAVENFVDIKVYHVVNLDISINLRWIPPQTANVENVVLLEPTPIHKLIAISTELVRPRHNAVRGPR